MRLPWRSSSSHPSFRILPLGKMRREVLDDLLLRFLQLGPRHPPAEKEGGKEMGIELSRYSISFSFLLRDWEGKGGEGDKIEAELNLLLFYHVLVAWRMGGKKKKGKEGRRRARPLFS